jgi:hypothetical protein
MAKYVVSCTLFSAAGGADDCGLDHQKTMSSKVFARNSLLQISDGQVTLLSNPPCSPPLRNDDTIIRSSINGTVLQ